VLARRVEAKASSPPGRHTDPRALAGDKFCRINYAGPRCAMKCACLLCLLPYLFWVIIELRLGSVVEVLQVS
jgi:hypothetical protein